MKFALLCAAALAATRNVPLRSVPVADIQASLTSRGVPLPGSVATVTVVAPSASTAGAAHPAIFFAIAAITAGDGAQPDMSASAAAARSRDRNCPCHR